MNSLRRDSPQQLQVECSQKSEFKERILFWTALELFGFIPFLVSGVFARKVGEVPA
jgi:hypothetical protein